MTGIVTWFESLGQDLRLAVRSLGKSPTFVAVVVLSLALGIGANSTIFSVTDVLLLRHLPYDRPEQLVAIWETQLTHPESRQSPPIAESVDWKKQSHVFQDIALTSFAEPGAVLSGAGEAERIVVQDCTPNLFELLGVKPILGRVSFPEEMRDHDQTVVISESFWKTHFNRDPNILGKTFRLSGMRSTIVGVMPESLTSLDGSKVDMWQPIDAESRRYIERADHWLMPVARLKPGVTLAQAQAEMDTIARRLELQYPATNKGIGKVLVPLHEELFGWARQALYPLLGAVAFVLLIACANVANLIQSRTEVRRGECALRLSLGASRGRLMQGSLAESVLLGCIGGTFGLLMAFWGNRLFFWIAASTLGPDIPNADKMTVDLRVVLFTLSISLLTALMFGLAPALQASRSDLNHDLRNGARGSAPVPGGIMRRLLAISEVALAMVLLVGTGLMINTLLRLRGVDPGFDTSNLLAMTIQLPEGDQYVERVGGDMEKAKPAVDSFNRRLLERMATLPGVESVGTGGIPTFFSEQPSFQIIGHPTPPDQRPQAGYDQVTPGCFRTLRIPLKKGRYLDEHDTNAAPWAIVVNEAFVRKFFPDEDPIGKQVRLRFDPYPTEEDRTRQIVGVVGDVKQYGLGRPTPPFIYASFYQQPDVYPGGSIVAHLWQDLAIRVSPTTHAADLSKPIKEIVAELDLDQPMSRLIPMRDVLDRSTGLTRFYMQLLSIFAVLAIFLAGIGIYGVMSYFVSRHTHDIGVRMALGAHPADILKWVARLGLKLVSIGIAVGAALAIGLTRLISALLFGVTPTDPFTYFLVALTLAAIASLACYIPARRATKVDPMVALRYE
ncbi:MAG TPA: ABC transporter permease [Candidatus Eisenbacteria bacterium]|nr:ABC transporter permease [Candidatus Eisenbacteria bacterium]